MAKFYTGLIKFDGSDRTYTVNCEPWFQPGQRVMVKMRENNPRLQVAEVISLSQGNVCRHSVVCLEEKLSTYVDPDDVYTMEDFDRFLRSHRCHPLPVSYTGQWDDVDGERGWTIGYFPGFSPEYDLGKSYVQGSGDVILIGPNGLGIHRPRHDGRLFLRLVDGVVQFGSGSHIQPIPLDSDRPFQTYMEWAGIERGTEVETPERDTSRHEIAEAIGNSGGGVYLSDGEWL